MIGDFIKGRPLVLFFVVGTAFSVVAMLVARTMPGRGGVIAAPVHASVAARRRPWTA